MRQAGPVGRMFFPGWDFARGGRHAKELPIVIASTLLVATLCLILTTLGAAVSMALTSAAGEMGQHSTILLLVTAAWSLCVTVAGFLAAGFLVRRLRGRDQYGAVTDIDRHDGVCGAGVWALAIVVSASVFTWGG